MHKNTVCCAVSTAPQYAHSSLSFEATPEQELARNIIRLPVCSLRPRGNISLSLSYLFCHSSRAFLRRPSSEFVVTVRINVTTFTITRAAPIDTVLQIEQILWTCNSILWYFSYRSTRPHTMLSSSTHSSSPLLSRTRSADVSHQLPELGGYFARSRRHVHGKGS